MRQYLWRPLSYALLSMIWGLATISSAATNLDTLESVNVGGGRALQGVADDENFFYSSEGGGSILNEEQIYRYDRDWNLLQTVGPGLGGVSHIGGLSTDAEYLYAAISDFDSLSRDPLFAIGVYDHDTLSYLRSYDVSADFHPDSDIASVARYHESLYAIEWLDNDAGAQPRILRYDFDDAGKSSISLTATYEIENYYANGIEFYGNYFYVTHGVWSLFGADPGQIDVYDLDSLSTTGVNNSIYQYTYDRETWHSEGLMFAGSDLWVAQGDYVERLQTPALPEYVTWVGSGSASGGSETSWDGYYSWDGTPSTSIDAVVDFVSSGTLTVEGNAAVKDLTVDGNGTLEIADGGLVRVGGTLTIDDDMNGDSFIDIATGGMLALAGDADDSLTAFYGLIEGADAIRWWDGLIDDWNLLAAATMGTNYTLEYLTDGELSGYTLLTVMEAVAIPGDANRDGKVDGSDVTILANNWQVGVNDGQTADWSMGDFNRDGVVDGSDVTILANNWQHGVTTAAAVPEPSSFALLIATLLAVGLAPTFQRDGKRRCKYRG